MCTTAAQRAIHPRGMQEGDRDEAKPGRLMRHKCVVVNPKASDAPERVTELAPAHPNPNPNPSAALTTDCHSGESRRRSRRRSVSGNWSHSASAMHTRTYMCVNIVKDKRRTMNSSHSSISSSSRCPVVLCSSQLLLPACPMAKVRRVSRNRIKWKQICRHLLCPLSGVAKQQDEPHILLLACVASIALFGTCLNLPPFHRHPFWLGHKLYADSWPCELLEILMSRINYSRQKLLANRINLSQFKGERGRDKRG